MLIILLQKTKQNITSRWRIFRRFRQNSSFRNSWPMRVVCFSVFLDLFAGKYDENSACISFISKSLDAFYKITFCWLDNFYGLKIRWIIYLYTTHNVTKKMFIKSLQRCKRYKTKLPLTFIKQNLQGSKMKTGFFQ